MNPSLRASKNHRDWTGLVCTVGMGLLVLLAWASLPQLPTGASARKDSSTNLGAAFAMPLSDAHPPALLIPTPALEHGS